MATCQKSSRKRRHTAAGSTFNCQKARINALWSLWYCLAITVFSVYLTFLSIQRFSTYISLPWPDHAQPYFELNAYVGFVGAAVVLLPFFVVASLFCVGNLANDGYQLGSATDIHILEYVPSQTLSLIRSAWLHSGPTASLLHLLSAFCLLLPKELMQAQLIRHEFLPKDDLWRTDLDFFLTYRDRVVVLNFLAFPNYTLPRVPDTIGANIREQVQQLGRTPSVSPEFLNFALALLIYAVRYPMVFWACNKTLSFLFSLQLIINGLQCLLAYTGFDILYKLQTFDGSLDSIALTEPFFLMRVFTLILYIVYSCVVIGSGTAVYLYIFHKYRLYLVHEKEKKEIPWKGNSRMLWDYLSHCVALILLLMLAVCSGPLLYDYMIVYRSSLDGAMLACVIGTVLHLFGWIVLWLFLTLKNHWQFRFGLGDKRQSSCLEVARSASERSSPLLVVNEGQTFVINDASPRNAIMTVVEKFSNPSSSQQHSRNLDDDDDVYWLKPKPPLVKGSAENGHQSSSWLGRKKNSPSTKHKVTFDHSHMLGNSHRSSTKSPKIGKLNKKQSIKFEDLTDSDDDGDYATLRDLPLVREENEDEMEELKHKRLSMQDAEDADETQTLLLDELDKEVLNKSPHQAVNVTATVHLNKANYSDHDSVVATPQSESSSPSPPGKCSETSSGIHSCSSISENPSRRSSSVDEIQVVGLMPRYQGNNWKSLSLQRSMNPSSMVGVPPPTYHSLNRHDNNPSPDQISNLLARARNCRTTPVSDGNGKQEPFGRAMNIRMQSFNEQERIAMRHKRLQQQQQFPPPPPSLLSVAPKLNGHMVMQYDRDSANYSLASSGDSDNNLT